MALKFTVLLIFVAASAVFANPAYPPWQQQQFSEEQQAPYNPFAEEQQGVWDNQFAEEQQGVWDNQIAEQQRYWENQFVSLNKDTIAQEIARAEQQALCHPITVFFVSVRICQQTATQCGRVAVSVAHWADVDVQICRQGWESSVGNQLL